MTTEQFDLIVLGAGSAARDGAGKAAREHGARVALVESTRWGGGCPNVACRPTKAYLVAAELAFTVNELSEWMGVDCGPARVDLARVRAWDRRADRCVPQQRTRRDRERLLPLSPVRDQTLSVVEILNAR